MLKNFKSRSFTLRVMSLTQNRKSTRFISVLKMNEVISIFRIRNNKELKTDDKTSFSQTEEGGNRLLATVTMSLLSTDDSGDVILVATNSVGQAHSVSKLIVNGERTS
jgi:hypothetical protein